MANDGLEKLKKSLYKKDAPFGDRLEREEFTSTKNGEPSSFWKKEEVEGKETSAERGKQGNLREILEFSRKTKKTLFFWLFGVGGTLVVLFFVWLFLFGDILGLGGNIISSRKIDLSIEGPSIIASGELNKWRVSITNNNDVELELADLIIKYPKGSLDVESQELEQERRSLGKISSNQTVKEEVEVFILGGEDENKEIEITLEYRVANSNAIFAKTEKQSIKLSRSPVGITLQLPKEMESGQEIILNVEYVSNSESLLKDVYLEMNYPPGFKFVNSSLEPASGKNLWKIGDLMPQEKRELQITGVLSGQDLMELAFKTTLGTFNEEEQLVVLDSTTETVVLRKSFFNVGFLINNKTADSVFGDKKVDVVVSWKNNLISVMRDANIKVAVKGDAVDKRTINVNNGFYRSYDNSIIWNSGSLPKLASISPGESGIAKFSLYFKDVFPVFSLSDKNFSFILEAEVSGYESKPSGQRELVKSIATKEVRIASRAELESQLLYSSGPFSNSGSLPPEVGKATTYTVVWSLSNYYNDISDVVVRASLPSYIKWIGAVSPSSENVSHNSSTNEVVWRIEKVDSATGVINPKKMAFQVSFVPSTSQIGDVAEIAGRASFEAEDDFTGFILRDLSGVLYTNSINEAKVDSAKGLIVE